MPQMHFAEGSSPSSSLGSTSSRNLDAIDSEALQRVLRILSLEGYRFTAPTPLTHQRVLLNRHGRSTGNLRDIFGWSMPFTADLVSPELLSAMDSAGILRQAATRLGNAALSSRVRVASLGDDLFVHAAFPTTQNDAVFFGPDTYRFARLLRQTLRDHPVTGDAPNRLPLRVLDIGCGSGAGGLVAARALAEAGCRVEMTLNDINPLALEYASVNAAYCQIPVELALGDALSSVSGQFDLILSNPPYLSDGERRAYRHGGDRLGRALSVRIATESLSRLTPQGRLVLYTGVAMVDGIDPFYTELAPVLASAGFACDYEEIDPDVFGEELEHSAYSKVDRIAAVGLVARRRSGAI